MGPDKKSPQVVDHGKAEKLSPLEEKFQSPSLSNGKKCSVL